MSPADALAVLVLVSAAVSATGTVLWWTGRLTAPWLLALAAVLTVVGLGLFMETHIP